MSEVVVSLFDLLPPLADVLDLSWVSSEHLLDKGSVSVFLDALGGFLHWRDFYHRLLWNLAWFIDLVKV